MNRDYEGISGSPGVNKNLTMRESLDRQTNKKLIRRASLVHQNNTDTIQATLIARPLPATSQPRAPRGISTSWVPRHTRGHFPSHRTLKKSLQATKNWQPHRPFPRQLTDSIRSVLLIPIQKVNHVELCRRVTLSKVQIANTLPWYWDRESISFTSHKIVRNQSSSSPASPVGPLRLQIFL